MRSCGKKVTVYCQIPGFPLTGFDCSIKFVSFKCASVENLQLSNAFPATGWYSTGLYHHTSFLVHNTPHQSTLRPLEVHMFCRKIELYIARMGDNDMHAVCTYKQKMVDYVIPELQD